MPVDPVEFLNFVSSQYVGGTSTAQLAVTQTYIDGLSPGRRAYWEGRLADVKTFKHDFDGSRGFDTRGIPIVD